MLKKLDFSSAIPGTILDKNGEGTGFTSVMPNSNGTQYEPSRVNLYTTAGTLALTATQGSNAGSANTLKNALSVGIDTTQPFSVTTRLKNPFANLKSPVQQGGIFLGSSQDNYAKLVAVNTDDGLRIQFFKEENGVGSSVGEIKGLNWAKIKTLDLFLRGNPATDTITAGYRVNSNTAAPISFSKNFLPSSSDPFFGDASKTSAGILAFTKNAEDARVEFDSFSIEQKIVKINFQTSDAFVPAGYIKDSGEAYNADRGYGWVRQDSLSKATHKPLEITDYARNRDRSNTIDQRIDTLLHMQFANTPAAAWEYAVPNGTYSVTVSAGDGPNDKGVYDSKHSIRVEGVTAIKQFQSTPEQEYQLETVKVNVKDGKLTVDAIGGTNTKLNYLEIVEITQGKHPTVTGSSITGDDDNKPGVFRDAAINLDVSLPTVGKGVEQATLNTTNVQLYRTFDNKPIDGFVGTSGGGDAIVFQPSELLDANTNYTFKVTSGIRDEAGASFIPYSTTFNTEDQTSLPIDPQVNFDKSTVYGGDGTGAAISSLVISPDGNTLYAAALDGMLRRWTINSDGTLSDQKFFEPPKLAGRAIIGIAFDPNNANVLWISHNDPIPFPDSTGKVTPAKDFTGKISKLTLSDSGFRNTTIQDYVVGLPRSAKDHLTESLAFGPDGKLYVSQGSNSAMGAPDSAWANRPERLLSGTMLQIDTTRKAPSGGFNVQTENYGGKTGKYNPFATNAPVKIYATGIRNAYDLVWHSNGNLYAPTNGSAAGGNTPDNPATKKVNEGLTDVGTQNDYLFKIQKGGYYGHPNPKHKEYILNGGNPTKGDDLAEVLKEKTDTGKEYAGYSVGIKPDADYKGFAYDFGRNRSPNGAIEYKSNTFGGALQGKLLVTEYSGGDDIIALAPSANGDIPRGNVTRVTFGLRDPLDLVENTKNGNLYVAELLDGGTSGGQISLLRASA